MSSLDTQEFLRAIAARLVASLRGPRPIFITGRFRSGTTALWNILRQDPKAFGIYEPLHDNLEAYLYNELPTDPSHRGVEDYFKELRPHVPALFARYRAEFGSCRLALAAGAAHPELKAYLDWLIELSEKKTPLVKFVRVDFRLPWLRRNFPNAVIIHIHRNPREQWLSMIRSVPEELAKARWLGTYQLNTFAAGLLFCLPEIFAPKAENSYHRAYYLSRVSRAVGEKYADLSINFEHEFLGRDKAMFARLARVTGLRVSRKTLDLLLKPEIPARATNATLAGPFAEIEQRCDEVLERRGLLRDIAQGALETAWPQAEELPRENVGEAMDCLNLAMARERIQTVSEFAAQQQTREILRQALSRIESLQARAERAEAALREMEAREASFNAREHPINDGGGGGPKRSVA